MIAFISSDLRSEWRAMGAFVRLYTFLSQIFDYANTDIEKRAIFYKVLIPLLDLGREREGIDLSSGSSLSAQ